MNSWCRTWSGNSTLPSSRLSIPRRSRQQFMKIDRSWVRKILVIKLRAIGDVLLSTAVLKNLRTAFPDARIDFLTEGLSRQVVEGNPNLDSVTVFNKKDSAIGLISRARLENYDLVLDLFGNPRSARSEERRVGKECR